MNQNGPIVARESGSISNYKQALTDAMKELSEDPHVVFLGQGCLEKGTFMSMTLEDLPNRIEMPVAEEMQLGMSIGLALNGFIPVSIYPWFNFLLCAMSQLVNHLDKMQPHVIVRVGVGSTKPLDPGSQHKGDMTEGFRLLMPNTPIVKLDSAEKIIPEYRKALEREGPTVLVEIADLYD